MHSEINDSLIDPDVFAPSKINRNLYGKFTVVPYRAFYDKQLHKHPVLFQILGLMCSMASIKHHRLFVNQTTLATITGKTQSTISRQIAKLVALQYVKITRKGSPLNQTKMKCAWYKIIF
ncbi:MAG: helix-turn-helix domain-containing protein [Alphaproteobacteria bacterium]